MLWLTPSLALCSLTLALSSLIDARIVAAVLGVLWLIATTSSWQPSSARTGVQQLLDRSLVFRPCGQLLLLCVAAVATGGRGPATLDLRPEGSGMTSPGTSAVHVEAVGKRFRSRVALDEVSLEVGRGVTGLLGPNGAGKTTLLRILATTLSPDSGTVRVLGRDPAQGSRPGGDPPDARLPAAGDRDVPRLHRVRLRGLRRHPQGDEWHRPAARRGPAGADCGRPRGPDALQDPRLCPEGCGAGSRLAQALLGTPRLLILDEPTVGLDPVERLRFRETVSSVASTETVLLSTHLTEDVAALCSHVIVLDRGRVRFAGPPADLAAVADGRVWESEAADAAAALSWLTGRGRYRNLGAPPEGAQLVAPSLEDGYMLLTAPATASVL